MHTSAPTQSAQRDQAARQAPVCPRCRGSSFRVVTRHGEGGGVEQVYQCQGKNARGGACVFEAVVRAGQGAPCCDDCRKTGGRCKGVARTGQGPAMVPTWTPMPEAPGGGFIVVPPFNYRACAILSGSVTPASKEAIAGRLAKEGWQSVQVFSPGDALPADWTDAPRPETSNQVVYVQATRQAPQAQLPRVDATHLLFVLLFQYEIVGAWVLMLQPAGGPGPTPTPGPAQGPPAPPANASSSGGGGALLLGTAVAVGIGIAAMRKGT